MNPVRFTIEKKAGAHMRAGVIETPHGQILTPAFIVVGTKGTVKAMTPEEVLSTGTEAILANAYHLFLEPGHELVKKAGGLHAFMHWQGPLMTDSGGFQVFSLGAAYGRNVSKVVKAQESNLIPENFLEDEIPRAAIVEYDGAAFKSPKDGTVHFFTPERSIEIQHALGADIIFAFDECTSPIEPISYQREALERTHRWARQCLLYHHSKQNKNSQGLFGVVQGGRHESLRKESAKVIGEMPFDGYGIGGSFAKEDMETAVRWVNEILPEEKPRHLLGIGEPEDLFMAVENGCDTFDCVAPTRMARHGSIYTKQGKINIQNAKFIDDFGPLDENCSCYTCSNFSRGYISHLFRAKEMLAATLASIHNVSFIVNLVRSMRKAIIEESFTRYKDFFYSTYRS